MIKLRTENLEFREIEGEVVALDMRNSRYIGINETGSALWTLLVEGTEEADLVDRLVERFGISESQARSDLTVFLAELDSRGLLSTE